MLDTQSLVELKSSRYGISIILSDSADFEPILAQMSQVIEKDLDYLQGSGVSLNLGWRELTPEQMEALDRMLAEYKVHFLGVVAMSLSTRNLASAYGHKAIIGRVGLAVHQKTVEQIALEKQQAQNENIVETPVPEPQVKESLPKEEVPTVPGAEPCLFVRRTIRSGQTLRYKGNLIVAGDVNPGGTVEATGDIVVMGNLRGQASSGCDGRTDTTIAAWGMQPTQLRLGDLIWEGNTILKPRPLPMKAFVKEGKIVLQQAR